jgi:hypothetical protein
MEFVYPGHPGHDLFRTEQPTFSFLFKETHHEKHAELPQSVVVGVV